MEAAIVAKYAVVASAFEQRARRLWAAAESQTLGYGGDALVSAATGLARETVRNGRREILEGIEKTGRVRRAGAGRLDIEKTQPGLTRSLEQLVDPLTHGDPSSALRSTCKSRATLASALSMHDRSSGQAA